MEASRANHPLLYIERQARQLEADIQHYLDAQSEGLLVGLSGGAPEDASSNGSRTPTQSTASRRRELTIPVRQPPKRKIGLRGARRGIARSMQHFRQLRDEELHILESQLDERALALGKVDEFVRKRQGLEKEIGALRSHRDSLRVQELKSQVRDVEYEIEELELKLAELRSRHRYLSSETTKLENSVQARLSSYENSLSLLDSEEKTFLKKPPIQLPTRSYEQSTFSSLKAARRTLSLAKDHWHEEEGEIQRRKEEVELDRDALRDGAAIWNDVAENITAFETLLRDEMRRLGSQETTQEKEGLESILKHMDHTLEHLETQYALAEEQNWKLLVAAIGAELEAFKEGREVLREAAGISDGPQVLAAGRTASDGVKSGSLITEERPGGHSNSEDGSSKKGADQATRPVHDLFTDEENDEPDPDLLVSHQD